VPLGWGVTAHVVSSSARQRSFRSLQGRALSSKAITDRENYLLRSEKDRRC
jgi:hypothetical protein